MSQLNQKAVDNLLTKPNIIIRKELQKQINSYIINIEVRIYLRNQ